MQTSKEKMPCYLDREQFCYVLALPPSGTTTVSAVFRSIIMFTNTSWKELANFSGLKRSSLAFKVAYKSGPSETINLLTEYLVIDQSKKQARFYDIDHKPEGALIPHVGPEVYNGEPTGTSVYTKVPVKLTSRLRINDPFQRLLTMTLKPTNGYLLGTDDVHLAQPNLTYQVAGAPSSLNKLLKNIHFVGLTPGDGTIVISVDDGAGETNSISSTTVQFTIVQSQEVSVPEIIVPDTQSGAKIGEDFAIEPILVGDVDNKMLELHITPFGCGVHGFKNNPFMVGGPDKNAKTMEVIYGRPAVINDFIANLFVQPMQEVSYLGVELFCGTTRIRKYIKIEAEAAEEETQEEDVQTQAVEEPEVVTAPAPKQTSTSGWTAPKKTEPAPVQEEVPTEEAETSDEVESEEN